MITVTLAAGTLLTLLGVIGYVASDTASLTAFIPSVVGVLLVVAALIARNPRLRPHAIHGALAIALIGLLGSLRNVVQVGDLIAGDAEQPAAVVVSLVMAVVLVAYLAIGIRSFVAARRLRQARASDGTAP